MESFKHYKIVLLGEGRVGKTSILIKYIDDTFDPDMKSTKRAAYLDKSLDLPEGRVKLSIWDTAGQEVYHALSHIYYRDANGAILVYDITDLKSFERVQHWVKELLSILQKKPVIVIAGNKYDYANKQAVSSEQALQYAESVGANHYYTSAKTGKGITEIFTDLATQMFKNENPTNSRSAFVPVKKTSIIIDPDKSELSPTDQKKT
eukprot:Anaeramoba_ignava/c18909_g2_i1.p1 GENE.c18909_g2_i1~~c18909_g2_i1.p1  ORF type:complete len:227 (+),score=68.94 c18909_g2_i1:65-682(+)